MIFSISQTSYFYGIFILITYRASLPAWHDILYYCYSFAFTMQPNSNFEGNK